MAKRLDALEKTLAAQGEALDSCIQQVSHSIAATGTNMAHIAGNVRDLQTVMEFQVRAAVAEEMSKRKRP